jgi:hypothetical protein
MSAMASEELRPLKVGVVLQMKKPPGRDAERLLLQLPACNPVPPRFQPPF